MSQRPISSFLLAPVKVSFPLFSRRPGKLETAARATVLAGVLLLLFASSSLGQSAAESMDRFGFAVAGGDLNGDGIDDLAIGIPGYDISVVSGAGGWIQAASAGSVAVIPGEVPVRGVFEFAAFRNRPSCHQNVGSTPGLDTDRAEAGDRYGYSLAAGDFDGDGADDLAIGIPFEVTASYTSVYPDGGAVEVLPGYVYP